MSQASSPSATSPYRDRLLVKRNACSASFSKTIAWMRPSSVALTWNRRYPTCTRARAENRSNERRVAGVNPVAPFYARHAVRDGTVQAGSSASAGSRIRLDPPLPLKVRYATPVTMSTARTVATGASPHPSAPFRFLPVQSAKDATSGLVITYAAQNARNSVDPQRKERDARESEQHREGDASREEAET